MTRRGLGGKKKSYNTVDYIIKQCLRAMLDSKHSDEIASICDFYSLPLPQFTRHWEPIVAKTHSRHFGITGFGRLLACARLEVMVFR